MACSASVEPGTFDEESTRALDEPADVRALEQPVLGGQPLNVTPTEWGWYHGQTEAQIAALVSNSNARLVSLHVESASPPRFTVATVKNSGSHQASWQWVHGKTESELRSLVASGNLRIVDIDAYGVDGIPRFAAILVPNTGTNAKTWWWTHAKTPAELGAMAEANNARLVDLHEYAIDGATRYAAVMIRNTGADGKAWWWFYDANEAFINARLEEYGAHLTSIQPTVNKNGRFNVILERGGGSYWWWYYDQAPNQVAFNAARTGSRIVDIKRYGTATSPQFVALFVDNSDSETTRIGNILRAPAYGTAGFLLKPVGGAVERSLLPEFGFDPASSIKTLVGVHAMQQIEPAGGLSLGSSINTLAPPVGGLTWCPTGTVTGSETMGEAMRAMLVNSDNQRTRAFIDYFGRAAIEQTGRNMGMPLLGMGINPGCGYSNRWSLTGAALLYQGLMDGTLLGVRARADLFDRMPGAGGDSSGVVADVHRMIDAEAPAFALSSTAITEFKNRFAVHYKGGHHWGPWRENLSIAGAARIPACSGSWIISRAYVWGVFLHEGPRHDSAAAFRTAQAEPLRAPVRAGLSTWKNCTP